MKKLITIVGVVFFLIGSLSLSAQETFHLEGRKSQMNNAYMLVQGINPSNIAISYSYNEDIGEYYILSHIVNGKTIDYEKVHQSDKLLNKYAKHRSNGKIGESLLEVCGTQAYQYLRILKQGLKPVGNYEVKKLEEKNKALQEEIERGRREFKSATANGSIFKLEPKEEKKPALTGNLYTDSKIISEKKEIIDLGVPKYRKTFFLFGTKVRRGLSIGIDVAGTLGAIYGGYKIYQHFKDGGSTPPTPPPPQVPPTGPEGSIGGGGIPNPTSGGFPSGSMGGGIGG